MSCMQSEFINGIKDPDHPVPDRVTCKSGRATRRFSVYRNNVIVSLIEALETSYPVIRKLVGEEFFRAMAGVFVREHPPTTPLMQQYAHEFPGFLSTFEPVGTLPYLPDVSRIELALRQAYHARDESPLPGDALADIDPGRLADAHIRLAPALRLVTSRYPAYSIWHDNTLGITRTPPKGSQSVAVTRKLFDPEARLLANGEHEMLSTLAEGKSLGEAYLQALSIDDGYSLQASLTWMLDTGTITGIGFD